MAEAADTLTHPILGVLTRVGGRWATQYELPGGEKLDVRISPGGGDRDAFLKRAADLFLWALENERRVLRHAIEVYLLGLYNDGWRDEADPALDADEFEGALEWGLLTLSASEIVPVEFWYDDGERELFGGHAIVVQLDAELKHRSAHLVG